VTREHTGVWTGPGILALVDAEWVHYLPQDVPQDLRERATVMGVTDRPRISIRLAEDRPSALDPACQGPSGRERKGG